MAVMQILQGEERKVISGPWNLKFIISSNFKQDNEHRILVKKPLLKW
jgi:hypothetical protein